MSSLPSHPEMVRAFLASDDSYDDVFFTAVRTTGIFCRPSCTARKPRPENVEFFASVRDAMFAGYRACKRCRPMERVGRTPEWVTRLLARVDETPDVPIKAADLRSLGLDPARVRRHFLAHYGMTFVAFARARRLSTAFMRLRKGGSLDDAVFESGFASHSGFRDAFARTFGTSPGRAAALSPIAMTWIESPLGPLVAGASERGVCLLEFSDRRMLEAQLETLRRKLGRALVPGENDHLAQLRLELEEYFAGRRSVFGVALEHPGSPFLLRVWEALKAIPYGETRSYAELAASIGAPQAVRAVGRANGLNRIAIVIPCHRVIGKDGAPVGYGGGLWRKLRLLELERAGVPAAERATDSARVPTGPRTGSSP